VILHVHINTFVLNNIVLFEVSGLKNAIEMICLVILCIFMLKNLKTGQ